MTTLTTTENMSLIVALQKIHKIVCKAFIPTKPVHVKINDDRFCIDYHEYYNTFDLYDGDTGEMYAIIGFNGYGLYVLETIGNFDINRRCENVTIILEPED